VITHAPVIAAALVENPAVRLVTLGGQVDPQVGAALGSSVLAAIEAIRPDLLLLGACGVDAEAGITAQSIEDAAVKRLVAARSGRVAVAADRRKLGTAAPFSVIDLAACDILCIEAATPSDLRGRLAARGPAIIDVET
jgi:DeoR/GlpR family transcriptional regulator of sugar metabolism